LKSHCFALPKVVRQEFVGEVGHIYIFPVKNIQDVVWGPEGTFFGTHCIINKCYKIIVPCVW